MDKIKASFRKNRKKLIAYLVVMIVVLIIGLAPLTVSIAEGKMAAHAGDNFWAVFFTQLFHNIQKPLPSLGLCFSEYFSTFLQALKWYIIVAAFFALIGILRSLPKHQYEDIENGSSDWSENGEQYTVLSKKSGIILAEKNYLPVDKRGNVNVLVVRRFWCW